MENMDEEKLPCHTCQSIFQVLVTEALSFTHSFPSKWLSSGCGIESVEPAYIVGIRNQKPKNFNPGPLKS